MFFTGSFPSEVFGVGYWEENSPDFLLSLVPLVPLIPLIPCLSIRSEDGCTKSRVRLQQALQNEKKQ
jgi:hypothetical protein